MIETGDPNPKSGNTHKIVETKKIKKIKIKLEFFNSTKYDLFSLIKSYEVISLRKNLVSTKKMNDFLHNKKNIKILIFTMENKKINKIDWINNIFINCKNKYNIIVIRDILNLFSSRLQSEKNLEKKDEYYETDKITIDWWMNNYSYIKKKKYITFNYNKFLCYTVSRKSLAKKLEIDYNKAKITLNLFGLTSGSSFKNNITNKSDYFMRWTKYKNHSLIKSLLHDNKIIEILCKDFSMCLNIDNKKIKICKKLYNLE